MDFKKKFDYEDINNFLPDNETIGKTEYFTKKFKGKMPDYICDILEIKTRREFKKQEEDNFIEMIKESIKNQNQKLIEEFEERSKPREDIDETLSNLPLENVIYLDDAK